METRYINHPSAAARVEQLEGGGSTITGLGAVFYDGTPDTEFQLWPGAVERIMPTAFDRALEEKDDVRILRNHDANILLGRTSSGTARVEKVQAGPRYTVDVPDTQGGRDTAESIRRGDMDGSSFSFLVDDDGQTWRTEERDNTEIEIREINSIKLLFDMGPVTFPAYTGTTAGVRSASDLAEARASYDTWRGQHRAAQDAQRVNAMVKRVRMVEIIEGA